MGSWHTRLTTSLPGVSGMSRKSGGSQCLTNLCISIESHIGFPYIIHLTNYLFPLYYACKPSNTKVLKLFQSNILCCITNAPWYVLNLTLHKDLQIPFVTEEIKKYSTIYHSRLIQHKNNQARELSNPLQVKWRLGRQWPSDLIVEREEEE
jgi:hypothetical protein